MTTKSKKSESAPPHRVRLSVPVADASTLEWLSKQDNASQSMRALVRDYIERYGYTDPTSRPVRQLPRRGRPPLEEADSFDEAIDDEISSQETTVAVAQTPPKLEPAASPAEKARERQGRPEVMRPEVMQAQQQPAQPATKTVAPQEQVAQHDPGSTPGASGVGAFLAGSRDDD